MINFFDLAVLEMSPLLLFLVHITCSILHRTNIQLFLCVPVNACLLYKTNKAINNQEVILISNTNYILQISVILKCLLYIFRKEM